jgi:hypothetical protein
MIFEEALALIKAGKKVCRVGAQAGHAFIYLHSPAEGESFEPHIALRGTVEVGAPLASYHFSTADALSDAWFEVTEEDAAVQAAQSASTDNIVRRQQELERAIKQAQHWEMMGDTSQSAAWRDYYRAVYALTTQNSWPMARQWPTPPGQ